MPTITVGYVSGFIALAVLFAQLFLPTILALILAACLGTRNNAVTWSVASRSLQSSYWPIILQTDTGASRGVRKRITVLTWLITLAVLLIVIASIVTPLGLYEAVVAAGETQEPFAYARDPGPFGYATPDRSALGLTRRCGSLIPELCPGSKFPVVRSGNESNQSIEFPEGYDGGIPRERYEFFASGLNHDSDTIAGIWDIEWRSYAYKEDKSDVPMNNGSRYLTGSYQIFQAIALEDKATVVEGLIVDPSDAGIGFRNHTLPPSSVTNASWSEDLLFATPDTACVPLNLTLDFTIGNDTDTSTSLSNLKITDRGGFASLDRNFVPWVNGSRGQDEMDLKYRAYMSGWLNNLLLMWRYNVTNPGSLRNESYWFTDGWDYRNSEEGREFPVGVDSITPVSPGVLRTTQKFGDFLQMESGGYLAEYNMTTSPNRDNGPFNISSDQFAKIPDFCQWFVPVNPGNVSSVAITCSMVYAPAIPEASTLGTGRYPLTNDLGTRWSIPLYSCATAVKASIKTVDFKLNGASLSDLRVQAVKDKAFADGTDKPVWAVESTNMKLNDGTPLWGLVDPKATIPINVTTVEREHLWLPGIVKPGQQGYIDVENMPSIDFPILALSLTGRIGETRTSQMLFGGWDFTSGTGSFDLSDYSGKTNAAMFRKWRELAVDANGVAEVINRVWTDVAANAVVGTKGLMGARLYADADIAKRALDPFSSARKSQSITVFKRRVRYHWPFAVPAFIVLLALVTAPLSALIICSTHKFGLASLRAALHKTSVGRILADALYPEEAPPNADTVAWIQSVGTRAVDYSGQYPVRGKKVGGLPEIVPQNGGAVPEEQHFLAKEDRSASRLD